MTATAAIRSDEPGNKLRVELLHPTAQQEGVSRRYRSVRHSLNTTPTLDNLNLPADKAERFPANPPSLSAVVSVPNTLSAEVQCPIQFTRP
jgi:hypothetical protein